MLFVACPDGNVGPTDWLNARISLPNVTAGLGRAKIAFNMSPAIPLNPYEHIVQKYTINGASKDLRFEKLADKPQR